MTTDSEQAELEARAQAQKKYSDAQYEICVVRGHTASGHTLTSNPPWNVCKWCGTAYRYEQNLIEMPRNT